MENRMNFVSFKHKGGVVSGGVLQCDRPHRLYILTAHSALTISCRVLDE